MKKFFTLIAVAAMAFAAQANELTIGAGLSYASTSPICGLMADTEGTMSQTIYPAEMISEMQGGKITSVTFYTLADYYNGYSSDENDYISFEDATIQLAFLETDEMGFTEKVAKVGATPVATTVPEYGETTMTFILDEPFEYTGKNLLVECMVIEAGEWGQTYFYGSAVEDYSCTYYWFDDEEYEFHEGINAFLPKVTFTYEAGEVTPTDPSIILMLVDQEGNEVPVELAKGADGDYTTTYTFEYNPWGAFVWDPALTEEENEANRPNVPFYFLINGVRYGADEAMRETVLGYAMQNPLEAEAEGFYCVPVGYSYTLGVALKDGGYYVYAAVSKKTGVDEINSEKAVAGVRYFNMAGQEMQEANGVTIVVTTYTDGTTSAVKVMK